MSGHLGSIRNETVTRVLLRGTQGIWIDAEGEVRTTPIDEKGWLFQKKRGEAMSKLHNQVVYPKTRVLGRILGKG